MDIKKQYTLLAATGGLLLVIFGILLFMQSSINNKESKELQQSSGNSEKPFDNSSNVGQPSQGPTSISPDGVAKEFYAWYFSRPANPLANGGFSNNMYLSNDFKDLLRESYKNGNDPVFCSDDSGSGSMVGDVTYNEIGQPLVKISAGNVGGRAQYDVFRMAQIGGKWLIDDIHCGSS